MFDVTRRITALESAVRYIPGGDDNHSQSVLLEMLDELREEKMDPAAATAIRPTKITNTPLV